MNHSLCARGFAKILFVRSSFAGPPRSHAAAVFFSVELSFHNWSELPGDVKALIASHSHSAPALLAFELVDKATRLALKERSDSIWGVQFRSSFGEAPESSGQTKAQFIAKCVAPLAHEICALTNLESF